MEVKFVNARFEKADTKLFTGSKQELKPFLDRGYKLLQEDGCILQKPAAIILQVAGEKLLTFKVSEQVKKFYGESRISEELFSCFWDDAKNGRIKFLLSEDGHLIIQ